MRLSSRPHRGRCRYRCALLSRCFCFCPHHPSVPTWPTTGLSQRSRQNHHGGGTPCGSSCAVSHGRQRFPALFLARARRHEARTAKKLLRWDSISYACCSHFSTRLMTTFIVPHVLALAFRPASGSRRNRCMAGQECHAFARIHERRLLIDIFPPPSTAIVLREFVVLKRQPLLKSTGSRFDLAKKIRCRRALVKSCIVQHEEVGPQISLRGKRPPEKIRMSGKSHKFGRR